MITREQYEEVVKNYENLRERVTKLENEVKELKEELDWANVDAEGKIWNE